MMISKSFVLKHSKNPHTGIICRRRKKLSKSGVQIHSQSENFTKPQVKLQIQTEPGKRTEERVFITFKIRNGIIITNVETEGKKHFILTKMS